MSSDTHVQVFIVLADSAQEHCNQELGLFFRVLDAEAFMATLSSRDWGNRRIEPREMHVRDVHDAHAPLLSDAQQQTRAALKAPPFPFPLAIASSQ